MTIGERIYAMRKLTSNWDGYGADQPDARTLAVAQEFFARLMATFELDEPQLAPSRTGGVCALWDLNGYELEMGVERNGEIVLIDYVFERSDGNDVVEGKFQFRVNEYTLPTMLHALTRQVVDAGNRVAV